MTRPAKHGCRGPHTQCVLVYGVYDMSGVDVHAMLSCRCHAMCRYAVLQSPFNVLKVPCNVLPRCVVMSCRAGKPCCAATPERAAEAILCFQAMQCCYAMLCCHAML